MKDPLHKSAPHESAVGHVTGRARYVDDLAVPAGTLVARVVTSPHARAAIVRRSAAAARKVPGVVGVYFAIDVPGHNLVGPIVGDEPLLAEDEVFCVGQAVALVVARDAEAARLGCLSVEVDYEPKNAVFTVADAILAGDYLTEPHRIARGDTDKALRNAPVRFRGEVSSGAQDHFYLETQVCLVIPEEGGSFTVFSSTQHPTECQKEVAAVLGLGSHQVVCKMPRMGGGFGGKESQATQVAALAALGAKHTSKPVKLWFDRDQDMCQTGNRHPFWSRYDVGFDKDGRIVAFKAELYSDGGWTIDLSGPIMDRALFHADNAYFIENMQVEGRVCRTNLPSNTAFRGFGGPQGMLVIEDAINRFAERCGMDPAVVRALNLYRNPDRDVAHFGQHLPDIRLDRIHEELMASSDYIARRSAITAFNAGSQWVKRGIGFQPVKFGISFTASLLNQAGALVLIYADGTVQVNHGGTEMGQGLHTKMIAVTAHELGVPIRSVRLMTTSTDKVPNTSATAASSGTDLNGAAIVDACRQLRKRLKPVAADMIGCPPERVRFGNGKVFDAASRLTSVPFGEVTQQAWVRQISLAASGFYATPGIAYDPEKGRGRPFYYFAYGGAVTEVEVNGLTGEHRLRRVDLLHDVGASLVPSIDRGQVEGGFVQGLGWLTMEEVLYRDGVLLTHGPSTYKIPAMGDVPLDFRTELLQKAPQEGVVGGSKAVGEPPFMLAISAVTALRHAITAFGEPGAEVALTLPATPEAVLRAVVDQQSDGSGSW